MKRQALAALICGGMVGAGSLLGGIGFLLGGARGFYVDRAGAHYYQNQPTVTELEQVMDYGEADWNGECAEVYEETECWEDEEHWAEEHWDSRVPVTVIQEATVVPGERITGNIGLNDFHSIRGVFTAEEITLVESDRFAVEYSLNSTLHFEELAVEDGVLRIEVKPRIEQLAFLDFRLSRREENTVRIYYPAGMAFDEVNLEFVTGSLSAADLRAEHTSVRYTSGECRLERLSGALEVSVTSGSLQISGGDLSMVDVTSSSGYAVLEDLTVGDCVRTAGLNGKYTLQNLQANALELTGTSGDIRIENCRANTLSTQYVSGELKGIGLETAGLDVFATSGTIDLEGAFSGKNILKTTSGTIRFQTSLPEDSYQCSVSTISGKAQAGRSGSASAPNQLDIRTTSGSVEYSFGS